MKIAAVIVAAGRGLRAGGDIPKQWQPLGDQRVIDHTLAKFINHPSIERVIVVIHPDDIDRLTTSDIEKVSGGATRQTSVLNGLMHLIEDPPDLVLIHDVARATVPQHVIDNVIEALQNHKAAAPALAVTDALWSGIDGVVAASRPREGLYRAQTPQGFNYKLILQAHKNASKDALDDVQVALESKIEIAIVAGCETNIKITMPEDFNRAQKIIEERT
ncbi:MAG: 2-C-methyl-D-erythritol 4-phosphate cytidylyltransferase [Paracoccaceae bacterium]|nr:2-C-methyl-D-erythritol 4-phosphate cytidylyltransferase [Paracoccaceae bacterium]